MTMTPCGKPTLSSPPTLSRSTATRKDQSGDDIMSNSPTIKGTFPSLPSPKSTPVLPLPHSHSIIRHLRSAQTLGTSTKQRSVNPPSLISQQHREAVQRSLSQAHSTHQSRGKSNSGALKMTTSSASSANGQIDVGRKINAADAMSLDRLFREGPPEGGLSGRLDIIRSIILRDYGIKSDSVGMSRWRIYVWIILLNAPFLETDAYLALIHRGASPAYSKVRDDTFRTLATDPLFRRRVSESSLIRLLNAVAWKLQDEKEQRPSRISSVEETSTESANSDESTESPSSTPAMKSRARALTLTTKGSEAASSEPGTYVQGMNVLAAPFLYVARSEVEAFSAFHRFITQECPGYVRGAMDGVHKGLALVDKVLSIADPELSVYLVEKHKMTSELYAFASVLTLCACTPPLPEVLRLWDFFFAYGAHLNIVCIVAQLVDFRNSILSSPSPTKILRSFPPLHAEQIIKRTLVLIKELPDDIYAQLVSHAK